jgi:HSP20 family protein
MTTIVRRKNADYNPIFNSFFNELFANERGQTREQSSFVPAVNIKETEDDFELSFIAPGMKKEDFEILLDNDTLSVSGNVEGGQEEEGTYSKMEYSFKSFKRSFTLPLEKINTEKIDAKYENGILNLIIPKREEAKPQPAKTFEVK